SVSFSCFFFFSPPRCHRFLHSFPTRRSSDLRTPCLISHSLKSPSSAKTSKRREPSGRLLPTSPEYAAPRLTLLCWGTPVDRCAGSAVTTAVPRSPDRRAARWLVLSPAPRARHVRGGR